MLDEATRNALNSWVDSMPKQTAKDYGCKDCPKQTDPSVIQHLKDVNNNLNGV